MGSKTPAISGVRVQARLKTEPKMGQKWVIFAHFGQKAKIGAYSLHFWCFLLKSGASKALFWPLGQNDQKWVIFDPIFGRVWDQKLGPVWGF